MFTPKIHCADCHHSFALCFVGTLLAAPGTCLAQAAQVGASSNAAPVEATTTEKSGERQASSSTQDSATMPYWSREPTRPFLAGRFLAGTGFGRANLSAGYGQPHWIWAGLEGAGTLTPYFGGVQGGLVASVAIVQLSASVRRTNSFSHGFIPVRDSIASGDLTQVGSPKAHYSTFDATLTGFIPYGRLLLGWELTLVRPLHASSALTYEEVQRAVMTDRGIVTSKLIPMLRVLRNSPVYAGALVEHLSLLGRDDSLVLRLGPAFWSQLTDHMELLGCLSWPFLGRDRLGFWDGMYGTMGIVYRFATEETRSHFP